MRIGVLNMTTMFIDCVVLLVGCYPHKNMDSVLYHTVKIHPIVVKYSDAISCFLWNFS